MRLIDADALKDSFCEACSTKKRYKRTDTECRTHSNALYGYSCFKMRLIDATPTIDAEPLWYGEWKWFEEWLPSTTAHYAECEDCGWQCSECKNALRDMVGGYWDNPDEKPKLNYCPNCGAKMRGGEDAG